MQHDRDYYRCISTKELVETVKYADQADTNWYELAIALAERLDTKNFELEDARYTLEARRSRH